MDENLQYDNPSGSGGDVSSNYESPGTFVGDVRLNSETVENNRDFNYPTIQQPRSVPGNMRNYSSEGREAEYSPLNRDYFPASGGGIPPRAESSGSGSPSARNGSPPHGYSYPQNGSNAYRQAPYAYYPQPGYSGYGTYQPYYYMPSPKELEKKEIKKVASTSGALTITIFIVMFVVALVIEIAAFCFGLIERMPNIDDPYVGFSAAGFYLYEGLASLLSIFIPTLIIAKKTKRPLNRLIPFERIEGKKLTAIVLGGLSLCMVAQIMSALLGINLGLFGIDIYKNMESHTATGVFDIVMNSICTALIPALVEEFAYRGLVAGLLSEYDEMLAVFGSAFLFGMLHGNLVQIPFALIVGFVLGYVRVKTKSMLPGILIHFGNNFYAVIVSTIDEMVPESYKGFAELGIMLIIIAVGIAALHYLTKNHKDFFELKRKKSCLTGGEKIKAFFSAGTVIASTIILCIESIAVLELM